MASHATAAIANRALAGWPALEWTERTAAGVLLVALLPLLAVCAVLILAFSRRSPLIAHPRVGRDGAAFLVWKLRTMWPAKPGAWRPGWVEVLDVETDAGERIKPADDPRVTSRLARLLRRYSVDELPQLANVLAGEMSLVGPRPLTAAELRRHYGPLAGEILAVRPGITGLWQVAGRSRLTYAERRAMDLRLVRQRSVRLHLRILARTVPVVLTGRDAW